VTQQGRERERTGDFQLGAVRRQQESETRRTRPGKRTRGKRAQLKKILGEAHGNERAAKKSSEWDEMMKEVDTLVFIGSLSKSIVVNVGRGHEQEYVEVPWFET
jgi:hypothetical protein